MKKLRIGILCNSLQFQAWQYQAIQELLQVDDVILDCFLLGNLPKKESTFIQKFNSTLIYRQFEKRFVQVKSKQLVDCSSTFSKVESITCEFKQRGKFSEYATPATCDLVRNRNLDIIIRFGMGIIRGEFLTIPTHGIWSYHHGNPANYRGGPPGLWEIVRNEPTTGAILQRLTTELDQGVILYSGSFPTIKHSYSEQLDQLLIGSSFWIKNAVLQLLTGDLDTAIGIPNQNKDGKMYHFPTNLQFLRIACRLFFNRLTFHLNKRFAKETWTIGICRYSFDDLIAGKTFPAITSFPKHPSKTGYYADPFALENEGKLQLYFENYSYSSKSASICTTTLSTEKTGFSPFKEALNDSKHLSYPFVFEDIDKRKYVIPENSLGGKVSLYEINNEHALIFVRDLLDDSVVDTSLIFHEGSYWLFCTKKSAASHQLYIYRASSLSDNFEPHLQNPVKTSISTSRSGGKPFLYNGKWVRPVQDCSMTYGGSVNFMEIDVLSITNYSEKQIVSLHAPANWEYNQGLHTVSFVGEFMIFDCKKFNFTLGL